MKPTPIKMRGAVPVAALLLLPLIISCKKKPAPPPREVLARYQHDADLLCNAMVACMKEDVSRRLANDPERRDMVVKRMDRDLCLEGQYNLIGSLSVDPAPGANDYREESYRLYSECAKAVSDASDCATRKERHETDPSCVKLRRIASDRS